MLARLTPLALLLMAAPALADGGGGTELTDTQWRLTELNGTAAADGVMTTLTIGADSIGGNGGCNTYGGSLGFPDGKLDISQVFSTMMACEGPSMTQEQAYFAALEAATAYTITGDTLALLDGDGTVLAGFSRTE